MTSLHMCHEGEHDIWTLRPCNQVVACSNNKDIAIIYLNGTNDAKKGEFVSFKI